MIREMPLKPAPRAGFQRVLAYSAVAIALLGAIPLATAPLLAQGLRPQEISFTRVAITFLTAVLLTLFQGRGATFRVSAKEALSAALVGVCSFTTSLFYIVALAFADVATAILVTFSAAPLVALLLERRSITSKPVTVITLCAISSSLALATGAASGPMTALTIVGAASAFLAGIFFGAYPWALDHAREVPLPRLLMLGFGTSALLHFPLLFLDVNPLPTTVGWAMPFASASFTAESLSWLVISGVLLTFGPYAILASVRRGSNLSQVAMALLFSIEPAVAILLATIFLGQPLAFGTALGSVGVVAAVTAYAIHESGQAPLI